MTHRCLGDHQPICPGNDFAVTAHDVARLDSGDQPVSLSDSESPCCAGKTVGRIDGFGQTVRTLSHFIHPPPPLLLSAVVDITGSA
jgi:hypothetical protein